MNSKRSIVSGMLMLRIHMRIRVLKDCGIAIDAGAMCLQVQETFHFAQTRCTRRARLLSGRQQRDGCHWPSGGDRQT